MEANGMIYERQHMEDFDGVVFPDLKQHSGNIIIFGAGVNGLLTAHVLEEQGIKYICYCDSDRRKHGTVYCGRKVISPVDMQKSYPCAMIIMTPYCYQGTVEMLSNLGYPRERITTPVQLFLGMDLIKAASAVSKHVQDKNISLNDDGYAFSDDIKPRQVFEWVDEYMIKSPGFYHKTPTFSRAINLDVTNRCTLNCRGCLGFKPYYKGHEKFHDLSWPQMELVVDRLFSLKYFNRFHLLGGETFLYKDLSKLLNKLTSCPDIDRVAVITNATVIPDGDVIESLKSKKLFVRISDYGELSHKKSELEELCAVEGIDCTRHAQRWQDIGTILSVANSDENTISTFHTCSQYLGAFTYITRGKCYLCPFAANVSQLGVVQEKSSDYVDILSNAFTSEGFRKELHERYLNEKPLEACRYCNGWSYITDPYPVAQQFEGDVLPLIQRM